MIDIQSATAENRLGKKETGNHRDKNIMSASATQGGHNKIECKNNNSRSTGAEIKL